MAGADKGKGSDMTPAEKGSNEKGAKMITLISSDNESFEVSAAAASLSQTISNMIEDDCTGGGIPLPNVTGSVLAKVLEYCNKHAAVAAAAASSDAGDSSKAATAVSAEAGSPSNAAASSSGGASSSSFSSAAAATSDKEDLKSFDQAFIDVDRPMLFHIVVAANYLNIKPLLDLACQKVADTIKDLPPEEIRQILGIVNDFTPEEEERIRKENAWAFDK